MVSYILIAGLIILPVTICGVGTYLLYRAYYQRINQKHSIDGISTNITASSTPRRPHQDPDIELGILPPRNALMQGHQWITLSPTQLAPSLQPKILVKAGHTAPRLDRSQTESSWQTTNSATVTSPLEQSHTQSSWQTMYTASDVSPPYPRAVSPRLGGRCVSPLRGVAPPTHHVGPFRPHHSMVEGYVGGSATPYSQRDGNPWRFGERKALEMEGMERVEEFEGVEEFEDVELGSRAPLDRKGGLQKVGLK